MLSVVVPTYNERENMGPLIETVFHALYSKGIEAELIIVDDDSPDDTAGAARAMATMYPIRCIVRRKEKGLATAVLRGMAEARGDVVAVMDADLSHSPEYLPMLYDAVSRDGADVAVGSRYVKGGGSNGWPFKRLLASRAAGMCARGLTSVRDATSGFFAFRKDVVEGVRLRPVGYKICLEVIVRGNASRVVEVPIIFKDRTCGTSKLGAGAILDYFRHLAVLYLWAVFSREAHGRDIPVTTLVRFGMVGLSGVAVNYGLFRLLTHCAHVHYLAAAATAIEFSILFNFLANNFWTWRHRSGSGWKEIVTRCGKYHIVAGLAAFTGNWLVLLLLSAVLGMNRDHAYFIGIAAGILINFVLNNEWTFAASTVSPVSSGTLRTGQGV